MRSPPCRLLERHRGHFYNWYDTRSLEAAAAALCLVGGQRNPRLPSAHLAAGAARAGRRTHPGAACFDDLRESPPATVRAARLVLERFVLEAGAEPVARQCQAALDELARFRLPDDGAIPTLRELARLNDESGRRARERIGTLERLARECGELASMEYGFLVDKSRQLLAIGYNVSEHRRDASYDLLASEARASFVAIAQGELPQESWFALGASSPAPAASRPCSWSGSMFEYLMPLVMPAYENTLLERTCRAAVKRQIAYGSECGVPWGMSESGYNTVDAALNYQYRAFGVPGLGLKRGLTEDVVVAPYASALALMVAPEAACLNLQRLAAAGVEGKFGFTRRSTTPLPRLPRGQSSAVALVHGASPGHGPAVARPSAARSSDAEEISGGRALPGNDAAAAGAHSEAERVLSGMGASTRAQPPASRRCRCACSPPRTPDPGGAASVERPLPRHGDERGRRLQPLEGSRRHALARGRHLRQLGQLRYLRDLASGEFWSSSHQPSSRARRATRRSSRRRAPSSGAATTTTIRTPRSWSRRKTISSCVACASPTAPPREGPSKSRPMPRSCSPPAATRPAPGLQQPLRPTEIVRERQAILCTRRPRSAAERAPWMFHLMAVRGGEAGEISYETDRARFIGRGARCRTPRDRPTAFGHAGSVLDPIVAIRSRITLEPRQSATIDMVFGIGETREACLALAGKYQDRILRIASSISPRRTAGSRCARSMPPSPTRSSMHAWRARCSTPTPRCAPMRRC